MVLQLKLPYDQSLPHKKIPWCNKPAFVTPTTLMHIQPSSNNECFCLAVLHVKLPSRWRSEIILKSYRMSGIIGQNFKELIYILDRIPSGMTKKMIEHNLCCPKPQLTDSVHCVIILFFFYKWHLEFAIPSLDFLTFLCLSLSCLIVNP